MSEACLESYLMMIVLIQNVLVRIGTGLFRSSYRRCSVKKVCKNFTKFSVKRPCRILLVNQKETPTQMFSCDFREIFINAFFIEYFRATASVYYVMVT